MDTMLLRVLVNAIILVCGTVSVKLNAEIENSDKRELKHRECYSKDSMSNRSITIVGDDFMLDGKPLLIRSGSVHYFRTPSAYWRDRLMKAKAAGLNAISTYVEWSFHEPEERQYRFEGDYDIAKFISTAAEVGLLVLLRPGPYICAERDLGGFPYWLLGKHPKIKLRTTDQDFIAETKIWMSKLFEKLGPLLYGNGGGPIILVQVENEYGSYGNDMPYKEQIRDIIKSHVDINALLYTTDGAGESYITDGSIPGALSTLDCGPGGDLDGAFKMLRKLMPHGPLMNSEYYPGWLTHWGEHFSTVSTDEVVGGLDYMIKTYKNFNMYMFHGGTNFEFTSGANTEYTPDITSYDYDAPLSEAGDMTHKYHAIRNLMIKYFPEVKNITPPLPSPKAAYGKINVTGSFDLLSSKGRSSMGKKYEDVKGAKLPTFEKLRQRGGLILYEVTLLDTNGTLHIYDPRDRVYVFVDGEYKGLIDRETKQHYLPFQSKPHSILSLLVENQGRLNFGYHDLDFKGILSNVTYNNRVYDGKWSITGFPLEKMDLDLGTQNQLLHQPKGQGGPVLYEGLLDLDTGKPPMDTFVDTSGWGKGYMWVNGHALGRYWPTRGPQITLYVPGVWLNPGKNIFHVLELEKSPDPLSMISIDYPILNRTACVVG